MFQVRDLFFDYENKKILSGLSCEFQAGRIYGLSGPSGTGKSTLCRLLAGQIAPRAGSVKLDGRDVTGQMSRDVLLVSQDNDLFSWQTVEKTIDFFKSPETSKDDLLAVVSLTDHREFYPKQLSGGMKKRLSLCRALSAAPKVLIVDELFSSQDEHLQEDLFASLAKYIRAQNRILIIVSHDLGFLKKHCDEQIQLGSAR